MGFQSFHGRVRHFWQWFPPIAGPLSDAIEAGELHLYQDDFAAEIKEILGPLEWELGRDANNVRFTLSVSPGGIELNSLLTNYWLEHQVEVPGWDFFSSKQPLTPEQLAGVALVLDDQQVSASEMQIDAQVDESNRKMNIQVWHPAFVRLSERHRKHFTFLILDAALGERNVQTKIGSIDVQELRRFLSLEHLVQFIDYSWSEHGWPSPGPLDNLHAYKPVPSATLFRRSDIVGGTTVVPHFMRQFVMSRSVLHEDPLAEYGASLMYLKLNFSPLEPKEAAAILSRVQKGLKHGLEQRQSPAYVIGASTGLDFSYIDFVLFDRDTALEAIEEILPVLGVDGGCTIEWFASR